MFRATTLATMALLVLAALSSQSARADEVATVTFSGVSSGCLVDDPPCLTAGPQEIWSGTFSLDLSTGIILSDSISGVGPGSGPWIGGAPGTALPDCLPGVALPFDCLMGWSDAAGWSLQWDPGNYLDGILDSQASDFFGMGVFGTEAASYSVTVSSTPEPWTVSLLSAGLIAMFLLRNAGALKTWR